MKRASIVIAVLAIALGSAAHAPSASDPNARLAPEDRVFGGGTFGPGCSTDGVFCIPDSRSFSVDAHAMSTGDAAYGDLWYGAPGGNDQHAQVTCLGVHGTKAVVAGIIDRASRPSILGWWVVFFYDDRGTPAQGGSDRATLGFFGPPDPSQQPTGFPNVCPSPDTGAPYTSSPPSYFPLQGDVTVQDARLVPVSDHSRVAVARGGSVQVVLANDRTGFGSPFAQGIANAVQLAVAAHPNIRGFPVQVTETNEPCGDSTGDAAAAQSVVADLQNVAVLGQLCSGGFDAALPVYEAARVVTISGSASAATLPALGPTVFDRTIVSDPGSDSWYAAASQLPSDLAWRQAYTLRFGTAPTDFADLYYDAAGLLLTDLQNVSTIDGGSLVIDRGALAHAVRSTTGYPGVTCTITLDPATGNRVDDLAGCQR